MKEEQTNLLTKIEELREHVKNNVTDAGGVLHAMINDIDSRLKGLFESGTGTGTNGGSSSGPEDALPRDTQTINSGEVGSLEGVLGNAPIVSGRETVHSDPDRQTAPPAGDIPGGQPGTGNGSGTEGGGSGFATVESLEIEGGTITKGDVVETKDNGTRMTVEALRLSDAGAREVACVWFVGDERREDSFSGASLRKFVG